MFVIFLRGFCAYLFYYLYTVGFCCFFYFLTAWFGDRFQPGYSSGASDVDRRPATVQSSSGAPDFQSTEAHVAELGVFGLEGAQPFGVWRGPTCSDGAQNGDETGVYCGGWCSACPPRGSDRHLPAACPFSLVRRLRLLAVDGKPVVARRRYGRVRALRISNRPRRMSRS